MKTVCVLGNGQLGQMLRQAGEPLGVTVYPVGLEDSLADIPYQQTIITAEIERWPDTELTRTLAAQPQFINRDIFPQLADRLPQKQLLEQLSLATAPWLPLLEPKQWPTIFAQLGESVIVKRRTGGYDGRGQWRIQANNVQTLPAECYGTSIVEKVIPFSTDMGEVSLVGARTSKGECIFYPLTHNFHQNGILLASTAFPRSPSTIQKQAEQWLTAIMCQLNYIGVMAMECFVINDNLLINELAPRVHNSGHWTQNGASISQFELHLRAILDLPLPVPVVSQPAVMVNLIGIDWSERWLELPLVHLHWYHKAVRDGRKVGHLNLSSNASELIQHIEQLAPFLPLHYQQSLLWIKKQLS